MYSRRRQIENKLEEYIEKNNLKKGKNIKLDEESFSINQTSRLIYFKFEI